MTIGSIASSSFYARSISAMQGRFAAAGRSGPMAPGGAMGNRPDPVEIFDKMDQDGSGGLDQTEFQTLADRIGEATGSTVDVAQLFETYDADGDGELSQDETQTAMEANRPEEPPPPPSGGMMSGVGGMLGGGPDFSQMFTDVDTDCSGALDETEAQSLADIISHATGQEIDAETLLTDYDADGDGVLSEDETSAALAANRPQGPPPPPHGGAMAETEGSRSSASSAIENYLKMAALSFGQDQTSNWPALFSSQDAFRAGAALFSVNTIV